ncbi:MAG: cold-shock protein [Aequorivita sp.]
MLKAFINKLMNNKKPEVMKEGTVKFFNVTKGFGFIKVKDTDQDIFVHSSNLIDKIREGDKVQFDVEQGEKGPSAIKVKLL